VVSGSAKLNEIVTEAQAAVVCGRVTAQIENLDWMAAGTGLCALEGLRAAAMGTGMVCATVQAACVAEGRDTLCSANTIPDCVDVTVDEYVACDIANTVSLADWHKAITCDLALANLPVRATPPECTGPYARCPALITP
jgi:hypothetical protein